MTDNWGSHSKRSDYRFIAGSAPLGCIRARFSCFSASSQSCSSLASTVLFPKWPGQSRNLFIRNLNICTSGNLRFQRALRAADSLPGIVTSL